MKKGFIKWIICGVFIVVSICSMLIFVCCGKSPDEGETGDTFTIKGTWLVVENVNKGSLSIVDNELMIFDDTTAKDYRNGSETPYVQSTYTLDGTVLTFTDLSRVYHISKKTDNYIALYTADDTYLSLIKTKVSTEERNAFDPTTISGKWNIVYRKVTEPIDEYFVFDNGTLSDYRNGSTTATVSAEYQYQNGHLIVNAMGKDMVIVEISTTEIALVETGSGDVWELKKAD